MSTADAHLDRAAELLARFEFTAAREACAAAAVHAHSTTSDSTPYTHWRLSHLRADVFDELGEFARAAVYADRAAAIADANHLEECWAYSVGKRIWIARQEGDARLAADRLRQLADRLSPNSHWLCAVLGSTLSWLGRPETALYYARRCLALPAPHLSRARDHRELARVLTRLGHLDEAREHLDRVAESMTGHPPSVAERYMLLLAEAHLARAQGAPERAARLFAEAAELPADPCNLRRHQALLGLARAHADAGQLDAVAATLEKVDWLPLGAEHRARALRLRAALAERAGDWEAAAALLADAREILASRYLALPTVLLIEAELAVADPLAAHLSPGPPESGTSAFNRAIASRDHLLMGVAKDLRGPIAVFELGAELLDRPDVEADKVGELIERALTEMHLLVDQLRHAEVLTAASAWSDELAPANGPSTVVTPGSLGRAAAAAAAAVAPVASARRVVLDVQGVDVQGVDGARPELSDPELIGGDAEPEPDDLLERAFDTLLALAVRAATPGSTVHVDAAPDRLTIELEAGDAAQSGRAMLLSRTAAQRLTAPTAGGPSSWRLANALLAQRGAGAAAESVDAQRVRVVVTLAPAPVPAASDAR